ncbi:MAG: hypothetical protein A2268_08590 [Candidatus Raymondbacteria bacterium RifOxyA12_full_50_37]|uniref:Uncharacterized protein n=1 Tax=Candidatus Raymondbacteria bacterium RIFOXYD12_FULL_49_13 TaxID=1817890 RepID=A0A1F7FIU0_UNCRA|nr:MAG: hypothetical protein A2268_08590 [Candidatus Raymondbacteria bacterium RifOxyA12_full_50_37]OGJ92012.1 MAG: hypothetical protein A2248_15725 [Candidatus Raymondbacteria bacterium RIFOXYA2_FULL_49_16]OGJ99755.1 MAG: hypothetical protein A2350_06355 [Candidatus Raymondbacteria bacterium RifOxyB12_full_50_8]OGK06553.1 MAG: hypothetical protein A2519_15805 [Candidatus Raymondbacteria bacterium RIFOXYD12_FULL_49_13]OGK06562.1 MAG: hypothetical protein A2487_19765 [Candidatus Raymondbacteria 
MVPLTSIYIGGMLTLLMALFHTRFYTMFDWKTEFEKMTIKNVRIMFTVHRALLLLFFVIGAITILYAKELSQSAGLAFGMNSLLSAFWLWRFIWQCTYFKRNEGQKLPPIAIVLTIVFALLFLSYLIPAGYRLLSTAF